MKITRHTAKDMRQALRLVREQLGADAVILTSKRIKGGVEVTAAVDFDAEQFDAHSAPSAPAEARPFAPEEFVPPVAPLRPAEVDPYTIADQGSFARVRAAVEAETYASRREADVHVELRSAAKSRPDSRVVPTAGRAQRAAPAPQARSQIESRSAASGELAPGTAAKPRSWAESLPVVSGASVTSDHAPQARPPVSSRPSISGFSSSAFEPEADNRSEADKEVDALMAAHGASGSGVPSSAQQQAPDQTTNEMGTELRTLRRMLETQLAQLAWNDLTRRAPIHTEILRELTEVGLSPDFASQIVAQLPASTDISKARRLCIALLAQRLAVTGDRWLDEGGRVALVGPTGVGKTTALAKLAVRWVLRHGPRGLALISADSTRIGAHDQIQALGQMLDVPVYTIEGFDEIPQLLTNLAQKAFVLIDTAGSSQRDAQLTARMSQLAASGSHLETALVLSASTQAGAIAETVARFSTANAASCLLTKVDEAASLGGVLSVLTRAQLPISYVSEGQRVPEDLRPARALELVSSAVQLAKTSGAAADEDLLTRRYGEVAHALA
ncbi:MAG: flagellar biosynthesis protein FlhF [Gammaproteobacteria bacterium]